jgi:uncharacterized membrane protein
MKRTFSHFFIICFVVPPFQAPDEFNHFYRSWQITEGGILGEKTADNRLGGTLPTSLLEISRPFQSLPFQPQNKVKFDTILYFLTHHSSENSRIFIDFSNTAIYAPTAYTPQVVAILIGKMLHLPPLSIFYLARLFTLIFWLSIVYLSIKIIPSTFQWLWAFLSLLPSSLFMHASTSADVVTNALSFLVVAIFVKLMVKPSESSQINSQLSSQGSKCLGNFKSFPNLHSYSKLHWHLILLLASTLLISLNKLAYAPLCLLILFTNQEIFGGVKNKHIISASLILANVLIVIWWASVVAPLHISYADYHPVFRVGQQLNEGVDPQAQVQFILHNPLVFSKIAFISFLKTAPSTLIHFVGKFGWEKNYLPIVLILPLFLGLILRGVFGFRFQVSGFRLARGQKLGLLGVGILTSLLLAVTLYLIWCPVGHPFIENLAGKYFIPIAPLFFLAFPDMSKHFKLLKSPEHLHRFDMCFSVLLVISLLVSVFQVLWRYYF